MNRKQLEHINAHLKAAFSDLNWKGLFTQDIRNATLEHRKRTATHIQTAMQAIDIELQKCNKRTERNLNKARRVKQVGQYRPAYKDD